MYGFTTTLTGVTFDQALARTVQALQNEGFGVLLPCNVGVRQESAERILGGFLDPQVMVGLVGKPEVKAVADAAERLLRSACARLYSNGAPTCAV